MPNVTMRGISFFSKLMFALVKPEQRLKFTRTLLRKVYKFASNPEYTLEFVRENMMAEYMDIAGIVRVMDEMEMQTQAANEPLEEFARRIRYLLLQLNQTCFAKFLRNEKIVLMTNEQMAIQCYKDGMLSQTRRQTIKITYKEYGSLDDIIDDSLALLRQARDKDSLSTNVAGCSIRKPNDL